MFAAVQITFVNRATVGLRGRKASATPQGQHVDVLKPVGALEVLLLGPTGIYFAVCWTAAHWGFTMAMYISGRKTAPIPQGWNTIDELRDVALSRGCTLAKFKYAIEVMGDDPHHVANYLQRHEVIKSLLVTKLQVA